MNKEILELTNHEGKKEKILTINVEEHGCSYAWVDGVLWCLPHYTDNTIETNLDYCSLVEESPTEYKELQIKVLELLGVDKKIADVVISRIGYYKV